MALDIVQSKRVMLDGLPLLPKKLLVQMLRNQVMIYNMSGIVNQDALVRWCQENCNGLFRINSESRAYFEEESDMVAFKVYWHGKEKDD